MNLRSFAVGMAAAATLGFVSCSSDSTSPDTNNNGGNNNTNTKNYMPFTKGSAWVYDDVALDTLTGERIPASLAQETDSITAVGTVAGRANAFTLQTFRAGLSTDTTIMAKTTNTFDQYIETPLVSNFTETQAEWRSIVDFTKDNLTVLNTDLANITLIETELQPGLAVTVKASGKLIINTKKGGTATLTIDGKSVTAQEYIVETSIDGTLSGTLNNVFPLPTGFFNPFKATIIARYWFADNIGIVKYKEEPYSIGASWNANTAFGIPAGSQVQKFLGRERTLVRYTLAK
ncbi:MAG: hypothetical protein ACK5C0_01735 [Candidatus Kapaibacterium sp.]|jgi:hypothetical protein